MSATIATPPKTWAQAISDTGNPFAIAASRYVRAPIAFVREVLGAQPDPWQEEALRALARGHTRIAIRSGHGCGKTALAAWVLCWFSNTRVPFKAAMTAPSAPQLFDVLVPETQKWFGRLPEAWRSLWDITAEHIRLKADPDCFVTARTSRPEQPEAMSGISLRSFSLDVDNALTLLDKEGHAGQDPEPASKRSTTAAGTRSCGPTRSARNSPRSIIRRIVRSATCHRVANCWIV